MVEIWKDIKGYEGLYQVSNLGRIRSLGNDKTRKTKILKARKRKDGYLQVMLCKNGKVKAYKVHRLVAEAFIPNPDNLPQVNHKNEENKTDNRIECLEWCDSKYNINYGTHNQRVAKKLSKSVLQFDLQGNFLKEYPSAIEVERQLGFSQSNVSKCCNGKYKQMNGYIWKYKEVA